MIEKMIAERHGINDIAVVDVETTGTGGADEVVELAVVTMDRESMQITDWFTSLVRPTIGISFGAMAVHHITEVMIIDKPYLMATVLESGLPDANVLVAHNAAFDRPKIEAADTMPRNMPWICTYRCARHFIRGMESYGNMALRYQLKLDISDMPDEAGALPHRALYDAWVTAKLLEVLAGAAYHQCPQGSDLISYLVTATTKPILLDTVGFGKHFGKSWADVPKDYLQWCKNQSFDDDTMHTIKHHLGELL